MVCLSCGYYLYKEDGNDLWLDAYGDDQCYDEDLNLVGEHDAVPFNMVY